MSQSGVELTNPFENPDLLREIKSLDDVRALADQYGLTPDTIEDYGTGFVVTDKSTLVKVPFWILALRVSPGDFGEMTTITLMTDDGRKCIINDGSTGIKDQVTKLLNLGARIPLRVVNGLTESAFMYCETCSSVVSRNGACNCSSGQNPKHIRATTYYLAGM